MKLLSVLLALLFASPSLAQADDFTWKPVQSLAVIGGRLPVFNSVDFRSSAHFYWVPTEDRTQILFTYSGPVFSLGKHTWLSPQVGVAENWFPDEDALNLSVWGGYNGSRINAFIELDGYYHPDHPLNIYSYCSVDGSVLGSFNLGIQCEGVGLNMTGGPHVGVNAGPLHMEAQYILDPGETTTSAIRFLVSLNFEPPKNDG